MRDVECGDSMLNKIQIYRMNDKMISDADCITDNIILTNNYMSKDHNSVE